MPRQVHTNTTHAASRCIVWIGLVLGACCVHARTAIAAAPGVFDVRDYGATGDGKTLENVGHQPRDCSMLRGKLRPSAVSTGEVSFRNGSLEE